MAAVTLIGDVKVNRFAVSQKVFEKKDLESYNQHIVSTQSSSMHPRLVQVVVMKTLLTSLAYLMMKKHLVNCLSIQVKLKRCLNPTVEVSLKPTSLADAAPKVSDTDLPAENASAPFENASAPAENVSTPAENVSAPAENVSATV